MKKDHEKLLVLPDALTSVTGEMCFKALNPYTGSFASALHYNMIIVVEIQTFSFNSKGFTKTV